MTGISNPLNCSAQLTEAPPEILASQAACSQPQGESTDQVSLHTRSLTGEYLGQGSQSLRSASLSSLSQHTSCQDSVLVVQRKKSSPSFTEGLNYSPEIHLKEMSKKLSVDHFLVYILSSPRVPSKWLG